MSSFHGTSKLKRLLFFSDRDTSETTSSFSATETFIPTLNLSTTTLIFLNNLSCFFNLFQPSADLGFNWFHCDWLASAGCQSCLWKVYTSVGRILLECESGIGVWNIRTHIISLVYCSSQTRFVNCDNNNKTEERQQLLQVFRKVVFKSFSRKFYRIIYGCSNAGELSRLRLSSDAGAVHSKFATRTAEKTSWIMDHTNLADLLAKSDRSLTDKFWLMLYSGKKKIDKNDVLERKWSMKGFVEKGLPSNY